MEFKRRRGGLVMACGGRGRGSRREGRMDGGSGWVLKDDCFFDEKT